MKAISRVFSFFLVLVLITGALTGISAPIKSYADEAPELILKLHYHRSDGNYDGWDVWLWEFGADGAGFAFKEENGEMVATKVVTPGTSQVGFIVRTASWTKDIDKDQFIDISEMVSGTVHVYVESKVEGYTKTYGDDAVIGVKVVSAKYNADRNVSVITTGKVEKDIRTAFTVMGAEGEIGITDVLERPDGSYDLKLMTDLDRVKSYTVLFDNISYKIIIPSIYSTAEFEEKYTYTGNDLGATWSEEATVFKLWAPTADSAYVNLYGSGTPGTKNLLERIKMDEDMNGTWKAVKTGDLNGVYYTYSVIIAGEENEAVDPYARTTGVNGKRGMVINLDATDPEGWDKDTDPNAGIAFTDAVIYELHIRDLSTDSASGIKNSGKYLGLTETGTVTKGGMSTGIDHIKELGITHLHILPFYDFGSVDEDSSKAQFNWGYDPVNYNVPEGSYATDAKNGEVRVKEVKQMVKSLHDNGISVVMDVVYNHVYSASDFCFNKLVPNYFSRVDDNGRFSSGSGCGNDTATERSMVRKYIVDSVNYWAEEYHIDGFRFDLVGLIDIDTMNEIIETVHENHPNVVFYGEGWSMATSCTKDNITMATQAASKKTPQMAYFSDDIRDTLKGSVFSETSLGYATGLIQSSGKMFSCVSADLSWTKNPLQIINYASCHDNNTLIDRITMSYPDAERSELIKMNNLTAAIYMSAQGVPFMQAGEDFLRSKEKSNGTFDSNSYASNDFVNQLQWNNLDKEEYKNTFLYYKGLISFRKAHSGLRMSDSESVKAYLKRIENVPDNVVAFTIDAEAERGDSNGLVIIYNPNKTECEITLPEGKWSVYVKGDKAGTKVLEKVSGSVTVPAISAMYLAKDKANTKALIGIVAIAASVLGGLGAFFTHARKNKTI